MAICRYCTSAADLDRQDFHQQCLGETQCNCQHRPLIEKDNLNESWADGREAKEARSIRES